MNYLTENNIVYRCQSGLPQETDTCLSYFTDELLAKFDFGLLTRIILIALKKFF